MDYPMLIKDFNADNNELSWHLIITDNDPQYKFVWFLRAKQIDVLICEDPNEINWESSDMMTIPTEYTDDTRSTYEQGCRFVETRVLRYVDLILGVKIDNLSA